ncbi:MAG: RIP metalloprotease RseP [Bacteroidetes bacterium]|nr:RIP metalloprotease RseP [Bacteroidota bacterium]
MIVQISLFLLSLSLLIVLHEMGHFFPAKWFKTRVEKFYLFFDFAPFHSLWKVQKGETEYGIGWLPLGGYVKISGMVDESMDTEALKQPPQPWEFRSKPAWQRLIIMIGGVTVNFILGFFIFGMLLWTYGEEYIPTRALTYGMQVDSVLMTQGIQNGDLITKVGDKSFDRLDPMVLVKEIALNNARTITLERAGQTLTLPISPDFGTKLTSGEVQKKMLLLPRVPFEVADLQAGKPAEKAGIKKGDVIIGMNDTPIHFYEDFPQIANQNKGKPVTIKVLRGADTLTLNLTLMEKGTLGVAREMKRFFHTERQKYSLAEAIPAGVDKGIRFLNDQLKAFGQMFRGKISAKDNLGSIISIGNMYPTSWDWEAFWNITASLSIILAFMNLLPIPALDGGYVVFLIWEVITRRRVSDQFMEKAVTVGFFLLLGLMIFAFSLDIWRHLIARFF